LDPLDLSQPRDPLFRDPIVERVKRVAVVDVGSNSVRLVVFDGAARSPAYFYNEKVMCGIGASLTATGKLDIAGKERAIAAITRFVLIAEMMKASKLVSVGTAALREAKDGQEFCQKVAQKTGLKIQIASGVREAKLAAKGVLLASPDAKGIVSDMGGVSMELARVSQQRVGKCVSSRLGPLILDKLNLDSHQLKRHIRQTIEELFQEIKGKKQTLYLVGGSWRALARLNMYRTRYPLSVLNEYRLIPKEINETFDWFKTEQIGTVHHQTQISLDRLKNIDLSWQVLQQLAEVFEPTDIRISTHGIREGLLYERMPKKLRQSDPLIEACLFSEYNSARLPGYGNYLFNFIHPLFEGTTQKQKRLIHAVCLLHDVTWRSHPDYRAQICFENATRGNLGGIDHPDRIFIALSLYYRYKNFNSSDPYSTFLTLLNRQDIQLAEKVGKAIRFGAMLIVVAPDSLARLKFKPQKNYLVLRIPKVHKSIIGEVAQARLKALAKVMECDAEIKIV